METHEKIRIMRELNKWSQEEMASKLDMSAGGYAKIERGESQINLSRLEQIANIFSINIFELMKDNKGIILQINDIEDGNNTISVYEHSANLISEIEKLNLIIQYKDELLEQKEKENELLRNILLNQK